MFSVHIGAPTPPGFYVSKAKIRLGNLYSPYTPITSCKRPSAHGDMCDNILLKEIKYDNLI